MSDAFEAFDTYINSNYLKLMFKQQTKMDYYNFQIKTDQTTAEILLAFLPALGFDAFETVPTGLHAFLPTKQTTQPLLNELATLQNRFAFTYKKVFIPYQNWNVIWESNFHPVMVRDFCAVRASFHEPILTVKYELVIDPKMAFGTGHHETTYMMLDAMSQLNFKDKKVLDFGCGTGILAILAAKLGAKWVDAIDIETEAFLNTQENIITNQVTGITPYHGTIEMIKTINYSFILANINRTVILNDLPTLYKKLKHSGILIVSGILEKDRQMVMEKALYLGFDVKFEAKNNNWICIAFFKQ